MADLTGMVAVVTGASRGVGRGIAEGLAEAGATVYITGRSASETSPLASLTVHATAERVQELGGRGVARPLDHRDDAAVAGLFADIESEHGRLDLLVNNAYQLPEQLAETAHAPGGFWTQPLSLWDDQCAVGLRGAYVASVRAAGIMVPAGRGLIINVSSGRAADYMLNVPYGVVKCGVDRMARDMAHELAPHGVTALALWPGLVRPELVSAAVSDGTLSVDLSRAESPRFVGRCVAALAMDPDIAEKTGGSYRVSDLVREYRFSELTSDQTG